MSSVTYPVHMVSTTHYYLEATSLEQFLGMGQTGQHTFQGQGRGWGASSCWGPPNWVNWWVHLLDDLLQQRLCLHLLDVSKGDLKKKK